MTGVQTCALPISLYVSLFPCNECAKAIVQAGIKKIVYESDKYADTDIVKASKRILNAAGVSLCQIEQAIKVSVEKIKL